MRFRGTLILFLVAALAVAYYALVERPRQHRSEDAARPQRAYAPIDLSTIDRLQIVRSDARLSFRREAERWVMISPFDDSADAATINTLLMSVSDAVVIRDLGPSPDRARYGLRPAAATVLVGSGSDTTVVLDLGNYTVDKSAVYATVPPGRSVLLLPPDLAHTAGRPVFAFRNKRVVDFDIVSVGSFTVRSPRRAITWSRTPEGNWTTQHRGALVHGDKTNVEAVLRRLRGLRATSFLPVARAEEIAGFEKTRLVLTVRRATDTLTVDVGRFHDHGVCVRVSGNPRVAVADSSVVAVFDETLLDFRDRHLLVFDPDQASSIAVVSRDFRTTIVHPGGEWGLPNPALGRIDQKSVHRLIARLQRLEFRDVLSERAEDAGSYGLSNPDITITIMDRTGGTLDRMSCRRDQSGDAYRVTSASSRLVAWIDADSIDDLVERFRSIVVPP